MDFENITKQQLHDMPNSKRLEYAWHWQIMQEKGVQLEWLDDDQWRPMSGTTVYTFNIYRMKPQLQMVPLDFNDQLVGEIAILDGDHRFLIVKQTKSYVEVSGLRHTYEQLQQYFTRLDGSRFEKPKE